MRVSTAGLPRIEAVSAEQLSLQLARNALEAPVRTEASDNAARSVCWSIIEGIGQLASGTGIRFLFKEDFYASNGTGRQVLNGAAVYRQALLDVIGGHQMNARRPLHDRTVVHPETGIPHRRWEWYGAGLLSVANLGEILVLEGKTQRWRTAPREGWADFFQFGAMTRVSRPRGSRPLRKLDVAIYDTLESLPTDKVHTGNFDTGYGFY